MFKISAAFVNGRFLEDFLKRHLFSKKFVLCLSIVLLAGCDRLASQTPKVQAPKVDLNKSTSPPTVPPGSETKPDVNPTPSTGQAPALEDLWIKKSKQACLLSYEWDTARFAVCNVQGYLVGLDLRGLILKPSAGGTVQVLSMKDGSVSTQFKFQSALKENTGGISFSFQPVDESSSESLNLGTLNTQNINGFSVDYNGSYGECQLYANVQFSDILLQNPSSVPELKVSCANSISAYQPEFLKLSTSQPEKIGQCVVQDNVVADECEIQSGIWLQKGSNVPIAFFGAQHSPHFDLSPSHPFYLDTFFPGSSTNGMAQDLCISSEHARALEAIPGIFFNKFVRYDYIFYKFVSSQHFYSTKDLGCHIHQLTDANGVFSLDGSLLKLDDAVSDSDIYFDPSHVIKKGEYFDFRPDHHGGAAVRHLVQGGGDASDFNRCESLLKFYPDSECTNQFGGNFDFLLGDECAQYVRTESVTCD